MKSTLMTALIVLLIACLLNRDASFAPHAQVNAQPPADVKEEPLTRAIDRYLEQQADNERRSDRPEQITRERERAVIGALPDRPDQQIHRQDRERLHETRRDGEHNFEQQIQRIEKMRVAAKLVEKAGLPDIAHQIHRQAAELEGHLREQIEHSKRRGHRPPPHPQEIHELLHQLQQEIHELKREVRELREVISESSVKPER